MIVYPKTAFISKVKNRLVKYGTKSQIINETDISRKALYQFLSKKAIRKNTLVKLVRKFEGEDVNVEDYIKPL